MTTLGRRAYLLPIVLLPVALALPFLFGQVLLFRDILHYVIPQQLFAAAELAQGRLPGWSSQLYGGYPFLAEPNSGVFYPPNLIFQLLSPERAATAFVLMHLPLAGFGTYRMARALDCAELPSAAAASLFVTSGYLLSMHGGHFYFSGAAWLPLAAACLLRAAELPSLTRVAVAALCLGAVVLNGELQTVAFATTFGLLLALARGVRSPRSAAAFGASIGVGLAISAAQLVPALGYAGKSVRASGLSLPESALWSLHPARWLEFVTPLPFGIAYPENSQWSALFLDGVHAVPWAPCLYLGAVSVLLAVSAVVWRGARWPPWLFGFAVLALLLAAGRTLPLFGLWHRFVPLASSFRYPEKFALPFTLVVAILAGVALTRVQTDPAKARRLGLAAFVLAAAFGIGATVVRVSNGALGPIAARGLAASGATAGAVTAVANLSNALLHSALVALCAALSLVFTRARLHLRVPLLVALLAVDGLFVGMRALSFGDGRAFSGEPAIAGLIRATTPPGSTGRYFQQRRCSYGGQGEGETLLERVRAHEWETGKPNFLTRFGLSDTLGYGAAERAAKVRAWRAATRAGPEHAARLFGAAVYIACSNGKPQVKALPNPLPRAFVARSARTVDFEQALVALGDPALDLHATALVEGAAPAPGVGQPSVKVRELSPNHLVLDPEHGGTLVLLDTFDDGWTATVDGSSTPILRAFGLFRAVPLSEGKHLVELTYSVPGLRAGAALSLLGLTLCAAAVAWDWRRRRA